MRTLRIMMRKEQNLNVECRWLLEQLSWAKKEKIMRKMLLITGSAATILCGVVAIAVAGESSSTNITVNGSSAPVCRFTSGAVKTAGNNMNLITPGSPGASVQTVVEIAGMIDPATARLKASGIELEYQAMCNYGHWLNLRSANDGLKDSTPTPIIAGNFISVINYAAQVSWGGEFKFFTTDGSNPGRTEQGTISGANIGTARVTITVSGSQNNMTLPVAAGDYSDTLTMQVGSQL